MRRLQYLIGSTLVLFALAAAAMLPVAAQQDASPELSQEKIDKIQSNCIAAQTALQRVQRSDVVTRTNKGRSHEYMLQLMATLNSRIALNKMSQPNMLEITTRLQEKSNDFYSHYTGYDTTLGESLRMQCVDEPIDFYKKLVEVREKRAVLKQDVADMESLINQYANEVKKLQKSVQTDNDGGDA